MSGADCFVQLQRAAKQRNASTVRRIGMHHATGRLKHTCHVLSHPYVSVPVRSGELTFDVSGLAVMAVQPPCGLMSVGGSCVRPDTRKLRKH